MKERIRKYYTYIISFFAVVIASFALLLHQASHETLILIKKQYNGQQSLLARQTAVGIEENFVMVVQELELLTNMYAVKTFDLADIQDALVQTYDHVKNIA